MLACTIAYFIGVHVGLILYGIGMLCGRAAESTVDSVKWTSEEILKREG